MNTLDIMFDYDDVVVGLAKRLHEKAHEMGLHDGAKEALEVWHGWLQYGVPKQRWLDVFEELLAEGWYVNEPPLPRVAEAMRRLHWAGHRIHIVTARGFMEHGDLIRKATREHIEEWAVPHETLTFAKDKVRAMHDLAGESGLRFDYAIDDGPHNYEALDSAGVPVYLLEVPHNREFCDANPGARTVPTVDAFVDMILQETA